MNIDKELIRHWACLCESEGESIDEEVESGYFDDNGGRREYKTLTDYANSDYVARTSLVHVLSDIEQSCRDFLESSPDKFKVCRARKLTFDLTATDPISYGRKRLNVGTVNISNPDAMPIDSIIQVLGDLVNCAIFNQQGSSRRKVLDKICPVFKNSFIADGRTNKVTLKPGKYKFTLYGGLPVDIEVEIREEYEIPEAPLERIKANMKDIRRAGAEYRKPNLPKESMSEVDDEGDDGTVTNSSTQITVSYDAVTSSGMKRVEFMLPLNQLETWLADIGARETYNDVIDDILLGTENNVHLSKPISTITLEMKKRKMPK